MLPLPNASGSSPRRRNSLTSVNGSSPFATRNSTPRRFRLKISRLNWQFSGDRGMAVPRRSRPGNRATRAPPWRARGRRGRGPYSSRTGRQVARRAALNGRTPHGRKPLPEHLPREEIVHPPGSSCTCRSGTVLRKVGTHRTEVLEYVPSSFKDDASYYTPCYGAWLKKHN
jgi:hypothetical protein